MGADISKPDEFKPEFKDFHANTVEEAVKILVPYLEDTRAPNQVIYFDGWGGLGASVVLNSVAEKPPPSLRNKFRNIIHIDCSRWKNRRALQRRIAQKLRLPRQVIAIIDWHDLDDDFAGVDEGSRAEIKAVARKICQALQQESSLVVFHNGSNRMVNFNDLGIPHTPEDPTSDILRKVLWTFQGRLRAIKTREKIQGIEAVDTSYLYFGSLFSGSSISTYRDEILHKEAREIARHTNNKPMVTRRIAEECCRYLLSLNSMAAAALDFDWATQASNYWVCDGIIRGFKQDEAWEVATSLHQELRLDGYSSYTFPYSSGDTASWIVATKGTVPTVQPETTSFFLAIKKEDDRSVVSLPKDMFQMAQHLHVLKLYHCTFSFSIPPFLCCQNIRFLGLDSCKDQQQKPKEIKQKEDDDKKEVEGNDRPTMEEEAKDRPTMEFFQNLWVLDICCTDWELTLSSDTIEKMAKNIREINIEKGRIWHNKLPWRRLNNIHKLRVIKPTSPWETGGMEDFMGMVKLEEVDLSNNSTIQVLPNLSGAICLRTLVLDGCIGLEHVGHKSLPPSLETFSFDAGRASDKKAKMSWISLAGCARLVSFRLRGSLPNLEELDLSNTSIKLLDLRDEVVQVAWLQRLIMLGCERLHAVLWPEDGTPNLRVLGIDTRGCTEAAFSRTSHDTSVSKEQEEGCHAFTAVTDMRFIQSLVPASTYKFCWNNDPRYNLNLFLSYTRKDARQNYINNEKMAPAPNVVSTLTHYTKSGFNIDKASVDHDGSSALQFKPLDSHVDIGEGIRNSNVVTERGKTAVILLMNRVYSLLVHDNSFIKTVIPESMMSIKVKKKKIKIHWSCLRWCRVERCPNLDTVFVTNYDIVCFNELEMFWAADLMKARCIWSNGRTIGVKDTKSFAKLRAIHLHSCPKLTFVLPLSWFYTLSSLDTLHIVYCDDLSQVFPVEEEFLNELSTDHRRRVLEFPKLQHIYLHELPKLQEICEARIFAPVLKIITVRGCGSLKHLPATTDRPYDRPVVECNKDWWEKLEWDGKEASHHPSLFEPHHLSTSSAATQSGTHE